MGDVAPSQTVYVRNLHDKLKKEELKRCLYALFGQFGRILDVVCMKTPRLRGQAWVVFADITAATNSLRALHEYPFFDRPLRLQYAKGKSDAVAQLEGASAKGKKSLSKQLAAGPAGEKAAKRPEGHAVRTSTALALEVDVGQPHNVLFVENLPEATSASMLAMLFQQFPGYKEARMVPTKAGIAFVDFENEVQASVAVSGLQGFKITPEHAMHISYAKR